MKKFKYMRCKKQINRDGYNSYRARLSYGDHYNSWGKDWSIWQICCNKIERDFTEVVVIEKIAEITIFIYDENNL